MEQKVECRLFIIEYVCPECKVGKLTHSGVVLTSNPPQYPHKCSNCDYRESFNHVYPLVSYEPKT